MCNSLRDDFSNLTCGMCKHFKVDAEQTNVVSTCKRIDHKHLRFWHPYFKSYDCGQFGSHVCNEFEPATWIKNLYERWEGWDAYWGDEDPYGKKRVGLYIDGNREVMYIVPYKDFAEGTFVEGGYLKWTEKKYMVQARSSPIGYKLITECNNGEELIRG